jgi:hypothetical protein
MISAICSAAFLRFMCFFMVKILTNRIYRAPVKLVLQWNHCVVVHISAHRIAGGLRRRICHN